MKLAQAQQFVRDRIVAAPALLALCDPLVYSAAFDPEAHKEAVTAALKATGVCFEIGLPELAELVNTGSGGLMSVAMVPVYIAESPAKEHAPAWLALVDAVIDAIRASARPGGGLRIVSAGSPIREHGYVLNEIMVAVPMTHG